MSSVASVCGDFCWAKHSWSVFTRPNARKCSFATGIKACLVILLASSAGLSNACRYRKTTGGEGTARFLSFRHRLPCSRRSLRGRPDNSTWHNTWLKPLSFSIILRSSTQSPPAMLSNTRGMTICKSVHPCSCREHIRRCRRMELVSPETAANSR